MRVTTSKQNVENHSGPQQNNKTGVRGVCIRNGKFLAQVGHNYKNYHVGLYDSLEEAEAAVIAKRLELHTHNNLDRIAA